MTVCYCPPPLLPHRPLPPLDFHTLCCLCNIDNIFFTFFCRSQWLALGRWRDYSKTILACKVTAFWRHWNSSRWERRKVSKGSFKYYVGLGDLRNISTCKFMYTQIVRKSDRIRFKKEKWSLLNLDLSLQFFTRAHPYT